MGIDGLSPALQAGFLGLQRASARLDQASDAVAAGAVMDGLLMSKDASVALEAGAAITRSAEEQLQTLVDLLT
ncbi:MAG: hypothetical protein JXX28_04050 [Deltaproteobacteria bacterium]|nr:hypothetical protein [Deltaproteobacteria bacterium]